jgi:hypothetical protein
VSLPNYTQFGTFIQAANWRIELFVDQWIFISAVMGRPAARTARTVRRTTDRNANVDPVVAWEGLDNNTNCKIETGESITVLFFFLFLGSSPDRVGDFSEFGRDGGV